MSTRATRLAKGRAACNGSGSGRADASNVRWNDLLGVTAAAVCGFLFGREITGSFDRVGHILDFVAAASVFFLVDAVQCTQRFQLIPCFIKCRDSISDSPVAIQQCAVALDRAEAHLKPVDH